ncbi:ribonuclease P protein component [Pseudooceanicola sp.]
MTPPEAPADDARASEAARPPAASPCPGPAYRVMRNRPEFLAAARARRCGAGSMNVQARRRDPGEAEGIRVGFTCSKKVGNAVARNRAKRRLREAARAVIPELGRDGWDYVLIGRPDATATRDFEALKDDLRQALRKLHGGGK